MTRLDLPPAIPREATRPGLEKAMLAHDIRGALGAVIGGLALIDRARIDPSLHPQVDRISAAAEALAALVGSLVGDGSDLRGEVEAVGRRDRVDLAWLQDFAGRRWAGEAAARNLGFRVEARPGLPEGVLVSSVDLCRILANLIGNALKFSDKGVVTLLLRRDEAGGLGIVVRDQGPGLGQCDLARIFEFGYCVPGPSAGEGIGLHVAKQLADAMGARLAIGENPEGGVDAALHIPPRLCVGGQAAGETSEHPQPDLSGRRVLLAEDNPTNQMVAREMLLAMKAEVVTAGDGLEALSEFDRQRFDLVIIDIEMPRLSGLEVIRTIRSRSDGKARTPLVALTAYALKEHRLRIAEAGADALISKPILSTASFGQALLPHFRDRASGVEEPDPDDLPPIDLSVYDTLADTIGRELMVELLDRIVADLEAVEAALRSSLATLDAGTIRTNSHILVSVAGAFGAARLRARAAQLNAAAHATPAEHLSAEVRACLDEIPPAVEFVRAERTKC